LKNAVTPLTGPRQTVKVFLYHVTRYDFIALSHLLETPLPSKIQYQIAKPLEIQVQSFTPQPGKECHHDLHFRDSELPGPASFYAIPEDSLPKLEDIEAWALKTMGSYPGHAFLGGLRSCFAHFAHSYYESEGDVPLVCFGSI